MREIKFRGLDIITKKFIYGNSLFTNETYYIIPFLTNGCMSQKEMMLKWISPCYQVVSETVGQFTGLADKNGVEIYEGDILCADGYWDIVIEFENGSFMCKALNKVQYVNKTINVPISNFDLLGLYKIIGNIHEKENNHA